MRFRNRRFGIPVTFVYGNNDAIKFLEFVLKEREIGVYG